MLNVRGHNVSAEIQQNSPLTDLKEGRNELDWRWLFFYFEILDICGAAAEFLIWYFIKKSPHLKVLNIFLKVPCGVLLYVYIQCYEPK